LIFQKVEVWRTPATDGASDLYLQKAKIKMADASRHDCSGDAFWFHLLDLLTKRMLDEETVALPCRAEGNATVFPLRLPSRFSRHL
jgi:hypothetical protein